MGQDYLIYYTTVNIVKKIASEIKDIIVIILAPPGLTC